MATTVIIFFGFDDSEGPRLPETKHIAVLPFVNVGDNHRDRAYVDGLVHAVSSKIAGWWQARGSGTLTCSKRSDRLSGELFQKEHFPDHFGLSGIQAIQIESARQSCGLERCAIPPGSLVSILQHPHRPPQRIMDGQPDVSSLR